MSIVFAGAPSFAVPSLRRLAGAGHAISTVITQPDQPAGRGRQLRPPPVKTAAEELGLPVWQPAGLRNPDAVARLRALAPEVIVAVAYGQILRQEVLDIAPRGVLNVHPSLLPRWRGASPVAAAILAGDDITGATIMLMDAGMDSGPVLAQRELAVDPMDTAGALAAKLAELGAGLLAQTLPRWLAGEIAPRPQDETRMTTCSLLRKEDGVIDWQAPAVDIWRRVRAYNPWPGASTILDGRLLHIWQAWPIDADRPGEPGMVVSLSPEERRQLPPGPDPDAFAVQTGRGLLAVLQAQRAGRRSLGAGDFLRGLPNLIGRRLGHTAPSL